MTSGTTEIADRSIGDLAGDIAAGRLSPVEIVESCLRRIEQTDGHLHAFLDLWADDARADAKRAETEIRQGRLRGPLHGIPVGLKDLVEVRGRITTAGTPSFRSRRSEITADVVERLVEAGAILMGKLHLVEFAFGGWGTNPAFGMPWNPWDLDTHRMPGGSSSGSAVAVAAGMVPAAIGSDTGGSIRGPASMTGIVGLKPTVGRVSTYGVFPLSQTLDSVGPMTRTVEDAAIMFEVLQGPSIRARDTRGVPPAAPLAGLRQPVTGLRVGLVPDRQLGGVQPDVRAAVHQAVEVLRALGAEVVEFPLPKAPIEYGPASSRITSTEAYANLRQYMGVEGVPSGEGVRKRILLGDWGSASDYAELLAERRRQIALFDQAAEGFDALLLPTTPITAPPFASIEEDVMPLCDFARMANYLGLCSLALPCGFDRSGLPVSLQIVGPAFGEDRILRLGWAYEQAAGWHLHRPDLSRLTAAHASG